MIQAGNINLSTIAEDRECIVNRMYETFIQMHKLTENTFQRDRFIRESGNVFDSRANETSLDLLDNITTGYMKRISGSTLWLILLVSMMLNIIVRRNKRFAILAESIPDGTEEDHERAQSTIRHRVSIMFR